MNDATRSTAVDSSASSSWASAAWARPRGRRVPATARRRGWRRRLLRRRLRRWLWRGIQGRYGGGYPVYRGSNRRYYGGGYSGGYGGGYGYPRYNGGGVPSPSPTMPALSPGPVYQQPGIYLPMNTPGKPKFADALSLLEA